MRSVKLLIAAAALTAFVAGPVLAADDATAPAGGAPAASDTMKDTGKKMKHHKKGHHKKSGKTDTSGAAPAATPAQ